MAQFFLSNPALQDDIKFEQIEYEGDGEDPSADPSKKKKIIQNEPNFTTQPSKSPPNEASSPTKQEKEKPTDFSKFWGTLSKEIMRNTHKGRKMPPTLESVNNRLNIFRAKLEKVDHLDLLAKESSRDKKLAKSHKNKDNAEEEKENTPKDLDTKTVGNEDPNLSYANDEDDVVYYSFKKKMQLALHKRKALEKAENERRAKNAKKGGKEDTMDDRHGALFRSDILDDKKREEKNIEFQTPIGQGFYEILKQSGDDTEQFRKMAQTFVNNYNKKVKNELHNIKKKNFPPQIPKFVSEETKNLNILLPDYTLFLANKADMFQNLEDVKPSINTPEYECFKTINKILDGKLINFWKSCQNN